MKIGYARVSTQEQTTDLQLDTLRHAGCQRIFSEKASGAKVERPELAKVLEYARPGRCDHRLETRQVGKVYAPAHRDDGDA